MHQTYKVVFLFFDGHLTAIFDVTKLPQFLVLPIYIYNNGMQIPWTISTPYLQNRFSNVPSTQQKHANSSAFHPRIIITYIETL